MINYLFSTNYRIPDVNNTHSNKKVYPQIQDNYSTIQLKTYTLLNFYNIRKDIA